MTATRLFRRLSLSAKLIASYLVILGVGGVAIIAVGSYIVSSTIMAEARRTVKHDLAIARAVYQHEQELIRRTVSVVSAGRTIPALLAAADTAPLRAYLEAIRTANGLHFVAVTDATGRVLLRTPGTTTGDSGGAVQTVEAALRLRRAVAAADVLSAAALARENEALPELARLPLTATPRAPPLTAGELTEGLVLMGAASIPGLDGAPVGVVYAGRLVNRNSDIVDRVWQELYAAEARQRTGGGTVTIFLGDVRISTNVRTGDGARALGTRVSNEVRRAVLEDGTSWNGRAFVVDEWSITAYEPLRDLAGEIIGMLYVGLPEASYVATRNRVIVSFLFIAAVGFLLVLGVTYLGIQRMTRPLGEMVDATRSIAAGDFSRELRVDPGSEGEIARVAGSFNLMLQGLRQMRADLEEWGRTLEEKVRERTAELVRMQTRVAQSERLASVGMLAAGVAHEINNPLGGILALTALAIEDLPAEDPRRENLEEVLRQTERCRDIVKHLLEFSRQAEVVVAELDVNDVLERTLALVRRQSIFFNVELVKDLDTALPPVLGDASQLQQVFMNVVMNAVQAMEERGTLTIATSSRAGTEVEVRIRDTGCGIPAEHLDHIFDPFFTTGKGTQGTGLGLSIAYGIVAKHHGAITVESQVGVGSTFVIRLPAAPAAGMPELAGSTAAGAVP